MVLADTSVWIRFLSGRPPFAEELKNLLASDLIAGHEFVYGELLIGDRGGRKNLLRSYRLLQQLPSVSHEEVTEFVQMRKLHGRAIGWIDVHLLASALAARVPLWTADEPLSEAAHELKIGWR